MYLPSIKQLAIAFPLLGIMLLCACDNSEVAGGVTDIENSVSGIVVNQSGAAITNAKVVGYYDSWEQTEVADSVEAVYSDSEGKFSLEVDTTRSFILYAENDGECVLAQISQREDNKLVLGNHKSLESSISGATSGYVRIVGTNERAEIEPDGSFRFESIPPGDITITFVPDDKPDGYVDFHTTDDRDELNLPPMEHNPDDNRFNKPEGEGYGVDFDVRWEHPREDPNAEGDKTAEGPKPYGYPPKEPNSEATT